ncbi:hypothetical protein ZYGR_0H04020 [Zygosaccharomyces rouxii]|uniref:Uncharacterized protein n=1 Tax=Zygosaccharomyces rouxii TaxID=4956 RepID=A0A1Q2ZVK4_ZYGRO|nr:hypothetical protein ZYGR_0H04020 [Zygosaccharomyces rouxii]
MVLKFLNLDDSTVISFSLSVPPTTVIYHEKNFETIDALPTLVLFLSVKAQRKLLKMCLNQWPRTKIQISIPRVMIHQH